MKTIFEQHMDMFTGSDRPSITDWMHVSTTAKENSLVVYYRFKLDIYYYNVIKVIIYHGPYIFDLPRGEGNTIKYSMVVGIDMVLDSKETTHQNLVYQSSQFNLDQFHIKFKIDHIINELEWNDYINLPPNMIDDINTRLTDYTAGISIS